MPKKPDKDEVDSRGQTTVTLEGQEYVLRPSREAISSIERQIGPIYGLSDAAAQGRLSVEDMGVIVAETMRAYGKAYPEDELATTYKSVTASRVADLIYEAGPAFVMGRLTPMLVGAMVGGYTASGEVKTVTK